MISKCVPCQRASIELLWKLWKAYYRCLKEFDSLPTSTVEVDNQWNVTFKSQDEWVAITVPVAQTLGWFTREKTMRPGVQMSGSFTTSHKHGYEWRVILPQTTVSFPGNFTIQPPTFLCPCKHKIVQLLTNLVEPWQVGDQRLPLLHEMVPYRNFRETILEEKERCHYLPLRTKTFQTVEIYLTKWHWSATLISGWYRERCTTLQTSNTISNSFLHRSNQQCKQGSIP